MSCAPFFNDLLRPQLPLQLHKALQSALQVLNDLLGQLIGTGEIVQIGQGLVLDPENIQAGLIPLQDIFDLETAEATLRVLLRPGLVTVMTIGGVVAGNEVFQVSVGHGMLLQGKVNVGSEIVDPDLLGLHLGVCGLLVKENHVSLDTGLIEDTRRQTENGMQIRGLQQLLTHCLTGTALKQDVIGDNDGRFARGLHDGVDVLNKVELLVGAGRPEILAVVDQILFFLLAFLVGHGNGGLFAEGRVGEDVIHTVAGIGEQGIALGYGDVAVDITDIVEVEIHQGHFEGGLDQLVAEEGLVFEEFLLFPIQRIVGGIGKVFLGGEEEAAGAAAGIGDGLAGLGTEAPDHSANERTGSKVLTCAALDILGVFLEQSLVDLALDVGGHGDPLFLVDHLHHAVQDGGVADLIARLGEDLTQKAALLGQLLQGLLVLLLQLGALESIHIRPGVARGNTGLLLIRGPRVLIRHFEEDEVCKLFEVVPVGDAVVAEGVAEAPDFGDNCG